MVADRDRSYDCLRLKVNRQRAPSITDVAMAMRVDPLPRSLAKVLDPVCHAELY